MLKIILKFLKKISGVKKSAKSAKVGVNSENGSHQVYQEYRGHERGHGHDRGHGRDRVTRQEFGSIDFNLYIYPNNYIERINKYQKSHSKLKPKPNQLKCLNIY